MTVFDRSLIETPWLLFSWDTFVAQKLTEFGSLRIFLNKCLQSRSILHCSLCLHLKPCHMVVDNVLPLVLPYFDEVLTSEESTEETFVFTKKRSFDWNIHSFGSCILNLISELPTEFHRHYFHLVIPVPSLILLQKKFCSFFVNELFLLKQEICRCRKQFGRWYIQNPSI